MKSKKYILALLLVSLFISYSNAEVLTPSKAYEYALLNANDIQSAVYQAESRKESITQEKSKLYPQINFSAYYKKSDYEYSESYGGNNIKQGLGSYTMSLRQSIYNPEIYSKINMEVLRDELFQAKVELQKRELAQSIFKVYLDVLKSVNKIELYKAYLEYNKNRLEELTKKYEMNLSNKMDLLQMRVEYSSTKIDLKKEKKSLKINELKLEQLTGVTEYSLPTISSKRDISNIMNVMEGTVMHSSGFSSNLKVKQAKTALKLSQKEISNSFNAHLPKVDLEASISKYQTDDPTFDSTYDNVKQVMLKLNIPIYSGGFTSSKVTSSEFMYKAASQDLISTQKEVKVEYDELLLFFNASIESVAMYKEALDSAELYVEAITQGYDHGLKSIIDLNDAKNKLYEVKYKYIENIYEMLDAYTGLLIIENNFENLSLLDEIVE